MENDQKSLDPKHHTEEPHHLHQHDEHPPVNKLPFILGGILLICISFVVGYLLWGQTTSSKTTQTSPTTMQPSPTTTSNQNISPAVSLSPTSTQHANWQTYKNTTYGFEIKYPKSYKAIDDKENLYGWPKAIVLFYKGGQSYDIVVEGWDTQAEYETKYASDLQNLTVHKIENKYITIKGYSEESDNDEIIATFKITNQ